MKTHMNTNLTIIVFALSTCAATLLAVEPATKSSLTMTDKETRRAQNIARVGGLLPLPGTPAGKILFINTQRRVKTTDLKPVFIENVRSLRGTDFWEDSDMAITVVNARDVLKERRGSFGVFIVDSKDMPISLIALEDGWAFVNVGVLAADNPVAEILTRRTQVELARVFGILCGGASSQFKSEIMNGIQKVDDLDRCSYALPVDITSKILQYSEKRGIKGVRLLPYARACEQGWAPAPTNDVQKAIWDKVHQLPTKPIKILPETKPVKD